MESATAALSSSIIQDMLTLKEEHNYDFLTLTEIDTIIQSLCVGDDLIAEGNIT